MALIAAVFLPLFAALLCWFRPLRSIAWAVTVVCLAVSLGSAVVAVGEVLSSGHVVAVPGWIEADGLGALVLLLVAFVCFAGGGFCRRIHATEARSKERLWWFYSNYNLFVFSLCCGSCSRSRQFGLGRGGAGYSVCHSVGWVRKHAGCARSRLEDGDIDHHGSAHCATRVSSALLGISDERWGYGRNLAGLIRDGIHHVAELVEAVVFAGVCGVRRKGRSCSDAHLAARCAQPGAYAGMRCAVRDEDHHTPLRDPAPAFRHFGFARCADGGVDDRDRPDLCRRLPHSCYCRSAITSGCSPIPRWNTWASSSLLLVSRPMRRLMEPSPKC